MNSAIRYLLILTLVIGHGCVFGQYASRAGKEKVSTLPANVGHALKIRNVGPLLTTQWGQGCFYNASCPADTASHSTCLRTPAGAGAIAMAQIMKFYNYPAQGLGEHGYPHPKYGIQYANFGATSYQWNNMPNVVNSLNSDVATLIYHCGVAQNMNFGPTGSTSTEADLDTALIKYFRYPKAGVWIERASYTAAEWRDILKAELDAGHPVLYSGFNYNGTQQHFFVCDGYQGDDSFHINWGYGGLSDGYFSLDNLKPDTTNFSYSQKAIFNLAPSPPAQSYKMDFENVTDFSLTFNDWTVRDLDLKDTYNIESVDYLVNSLKFDISTKGISLVEAELYTV